MDYNDFKKLVKISYLMSLVYVVIIIINGLGIITSITSNNLFNLFLNIFLLIFNSILYYNNWYKNYLNKSIKIKIYGDRIKKSQIKKLLKLLPKRFMKYNCNLYIIDDHTKFDKFWNTSYYTLEQIYQFKMKMIGGFFSTHRNKKDIVLCLENSNGLNAKNIEQELCSTFALYHELKHLDQFYLETLMNSNGNWSNRPEEIEANEFAYDMINNNKYKIKKILKGEM